MIPARHLPRLLLVGALSCAPSLARAQEPQEPQKVEAPPEAASAAAPQGAPLGETRRDALYARAEKQPWRGVLYSALLPGAGSIYARRPFLGLLYMSAFGMSMFVGVNGVLRDDAVFTVSGLGAGAALYAGSLVSAYFNVDRYNRELRQRYRVEEFALIPAPGGAALVLRF